MAVRRPLVDVGGELKELPAADTLGNDQLPTTLSDKTLGGVTTLPGGGQLRTWDATDLDIDGLIGGSAFGLLIEGQASGHLTIGLKSNDVGDTFAVVSKQAGNATYTLRCFQVDASGNMTWAGTATGDMPASNLTGTISDARLPATFAAQKTFSAPILFPTAGPSPSFNVNGSAASAQPNGLYVADLGGTAGTTLNPVFTAAILGQLNAARSVGFTVDQTGYMWSFRTHTAPATYTWQSKVKFADQLTTARTLALSGGATGTATSFDGSANITIPVTALDVSALVGTIPVSNMPTTGLATTTFAGLRVEAATPSVILVETDQAADAKRWQFIGFETDFILQHATDAGVATNVTRWQRDGKMVHAGAIQWTGTGQGDGSLLTNVPTSALTGVLPNARLSGTYSDITIKVDAARSIYSLPGAGTGSAQGRMVSHLAGAYRDSTAALTGAIVFVPPSTPNGLMHDLEFFGQTHSAGTNTNNLGACTLDFRVRGYFTTASFWQTLRKVNRGNVDVLVRVGTTPTGTPCIIIGDETKTWGHPYIAVRAASFSHSAVTDAYCEGWTSSLVTDLTGYANIQTLTSSALATDVTGKSEGVGSAVVSSTGGVTISHSTPQITLIETDQVANAQRTQMLMFNGDVVFQEQNDDGTQQVNRLTLDRGNGVAVNGWLVVNGGQVAFPATQAPSAGANTLDDYREASYTATATGMTTSPTTLVRATKIGNQVTLDFDADISGTSNATTFTLTGMPTNFRPARTKTVTMPVKDNGGAFAMGRCDIGTDGVMTLFKDLDGTAFTNTGTKAVGRISVNYTIA